MVGMPTVRRWGVAVLPAVLVIAVKGLVFEGAIPVGHERVDVILTVLELVALLLPALAIALQVLLTYSESFPIQSQGRGPALRRMSFLTVGVASASLFFAVLILLGSVNLEPTLWLGIALVWFAVYLFTLLPLTAALVAFRAEEADEQFHDVLGLYRPIAEYVHYPREVQELAAEHYARVTEAERE
ncbi:hypothetical protein [Haladaptatus salinisoli]|uniref:hypothetical protein n=1 Tax=Haladaptatus salinisoli TaxID=2884876 RepID=UPI001D0AAD9C|nr:hypothetical protein [Haladaptatus salinisoli]